MQHNRNHHPIGDARGRADANEGQRTGGNVQGRTKRKTLPKLRSNISEVLIWATSAALFMGSLVTSNSALHYTEVTFILISVLLPILFVVEFSLRLLYVFEEYHHLVTRYESQLSILIGDVLYFSSSTFVIFLLSVFTTILVFIIYGKLPHKLWYDLGPTSVLLSVIAALILNRVLGLQCGPLYDSLWIENSNGLDYGSGMAHSFFHGYLKLIIPKTGNSEKHLEELMKDYEDSHHVTLEFYKLFILIPKSLYCPTSLMNEEYSPTIEESSSLSPKVLTVAGVQNRVYKNSVYKIRAERDRKIYVAAEYATPLKTFKDVVSFNGEHSNYYKKHKNDIVLQFYLTLQKVLKEHENCTNYCELIFYDDKDENGRYKDVGQILLRRINKLERNSRELTNN